jgi:hypothetical protein
MPFLGGRASRKGLTVEKGQVVDENGVIHTFPSKLNI